MSSHTWRMQWASCWRTEKILVSMALPGSSLNSKYIRMLPIGSAWGEVLETDTYMENGAGHMLVMLWMLDFTGLAKGCLSMFWKCTWVLCTSVSLILQTFVWSSHSGEQRFLKHGKPNSACLRTVSIKLLKRHWSKLLQGLLLVSAALILPFSEYEFELFVSLCDCCPVECFNRMSLLPLKPV